MIYEYILFPHAVRELPLDIGGGGGGLEFLPGHFYLFLQMRLKAVFFSLQGRLEIFISILLYLFQPPLWIKYLCPPCLVVIYLFHPFSAQKY